MIGSPSITLKSRTVKPHWTRWSESSTRKRATWVRIHFERDKRSRGGGEKKSQKKFGKTYLKWNEPGWSWLWSRLVFVRLVSWAAGPSLFYSPAFELTSVSLRAVRSVTSSSVSAPLTTETTTTKKKKKKRSEKAFVAPNFSIFWVGIHFCFLRGFFEFVADFFCFSGAEIRTGSFSGPGSS